MLSRRAMINMTHSAWEFERVFCEENFTDNFEKGFILFWNFQADDDDADSKKDSGKSSKKDSSVKPPLNAGNEYGQEYICWSCDKSLYGHRFVNKEGHPYCVPCFHEKFGNYCKKCGELIEADTKVRIKFILVWKLLKRQKVSSAKRRILNILNMAGQGLTYNSKNFHWLSQTARARND